MLCEYLDYGLPEAGSDDIAIRKIRFGLPKSGIRKLGHDLLVSVTSTASSEQEDVL